MPQRAVILFSCLLTFLISNQRSAQPQQICGKIIDAKSARPLNGAIAKIQHSEFVAKTDKSGRYCLDYAPGEFMVTFGKTGYFPQAVGLNLAQKEPPTPSETPAHRPEPATTPPAALEITVRSLADKLVAHLVEGKQLQVGVLEFLDLPGRITQLGKFIAEDLTTAIFEKGKFSMVERGVLQQVMREHALVQTGIIDITQAQEIGKIVGADAIITGSLSDIGYEIKINARLIDVGSGTLLAVAGAGIAKTENVAKMFNTILWSPDGKKMPPPKSTETPPISTPAGYVLYEDFESVAEGMLPESWLGGEKLMVKSDGRQKFITDFERQRSHKLLIDDLAFPENFEFAVVFQFGGQARGTHLIAYLGSMKLTIDVYGWYRLNNTKVEKRMDWRGKVVKAALTKEGAIFKLFINGEKVILIRNTTYKLPQALSLEFQNMSGFKLMKVYLRAL